MNTFLFGLVALSAKGALVVLVVLSTQYLLRHYLPAGFRHALWGLVGLRLMLPVLPESPLSILRTAPRLQSTSPLPGLAPWFETAAVAETAADPALSPPAPDGAMWALGIWILVTMILLVRWALAHRRIGRVLRQAAPVDNAKAQRLFESCRLAVGIHRQVRLLESEAVQGPATYGTLCPAVLVPTDFFDRQREGQQKNILSMYQR